MQRYILSSLIALGLATSALAGGQFPYTDPTRVAKGEVLYQEYCAACHGTNLEGQENWKEPDAEGYLPAPPHDETGHTWHHADGLLIQIVTHGTEALIGGTYKSNMQGFGDVMSDDDILDVMAFIKSTWPQEVIEIHNDINARMSLGGG